MKGIQILLLLFLVSLYSNAQEAESYLDTVLIALKDLDFDGASQGISNLKDEPLGQRLQTLTYILYSKEKLKLSDSIRLNTASSTSPTIQLLDRLNRGSFGLYVKPYEMATFRNLYDAYSLSKEIESVELRKMSLLALLEFFQKEITQSNSLFQEYLEEFRTLANTTVDHSWYYLYAVILKTKSVFELNKAFYDDHRKLDSLFKLLPADHELKYYYYLEKGLKYQLKAQPDSAKVYYSRNIALIKDEPYLNYKKFASFLKLSNIYNLEGNYREAIETVKQSYENIGEGSDTLRNYYYSQKYLSDYYRNIKKPDSAYYYLKNANDIASKLDYRSNSIEISQLYVQLQTEEKERRNVTLAADIARSKKENRYLLIGASLLLLLGGFIAFLLQKNTSKKRKLAEQERLIEKQKVETLLREQELVSIDAMIAGQEKERQRVANELHDDLGSLMATVKLHFDNVKKNNNDKALSNAQELLEEAYQKIRGMAHSKNSGVMANQGLVPAVQKMATTLSDTNAIDVTVADYGMEERLENSLELTIFRMIQELVANIIKHAEASKANIQFTQHEDNLNIIVEDNGKGFTRAHNGTKMMGMGLTNIEKRIEHLEGNFTVDSIPGKGTSVLIDIPI
ncbi:MAG: sensor histidine kinase [Flavobacteriaceae bacterium]